MQTARLKSRDHRCLVLGLAGLALLGLVPGPSQAAPHGTGWVPDSASVYNSFPTVPRYRAFLPAEVDLSSRFPRPGDQGKQGSCSAWSVGYSLRSYYAYAQQGWSLDDPHHLFSPAYLYNQLRQRESSNSCEVGTRISDALDLVKNKGIASLADFPYHEESCTNLPDASTQVAASPFRIDGVEVLHADGPHFLDDIKGRLEQGVPVVFGMLIEPSFDNLKADQIYDNVQPVDRSGHAMVVVGYSEAKQAFKIINSWGTGWGTGGFGWISYRAFGALVNQAYVAQLTGLPTPIRIGRPSPAPAPEVIAVVPPPSPAPAPQPPVPPVPTPPTPVPGPTPVIHTVVPPAPAPAPPSPPPVIPVPKPAPAPPLPPPVTPADLKRIVGRLDGSLHAYECAQLQASLFDPSTILISGYLASDADLATLRQTATSAAGSDHLRFDVTVAPWPLCEVRQTLDASLAKPAGLTLKVAGATSQTEPVPLHSQQLMTFSVQTPDFPSYLYVIYVDVQGTATVLQQPAALLMNATPPQTQITLGADPKGPQFQISPPFGREMVVAVASGSPLFDAKLPAQQTEREFLTAFRAAYLKESASGKSNRRVAAAVVPILTEQ